MSYQGDLNELCKAWKQIGYMEMQIEQALGVLRNEQFTPNEQVELAIAQLDRKMKK